MKYLIITLCVAAVACGRDRKEKQEPKPDDRVAQLVDLYADMLAKAEQVRDQETGWLDRHGCDAMLWSSVYAASPWVSGVDLKAAEFEGQPGRFGRRPPPHCWDPENGDQGSKTTWSRDMFVGGLLPWAWLTKQLDVLDRHASYGKSVNWKMGEPLDDGRVVYSLSVIGLLYQAIYRLGGEDSANRIWPSVYPQGLRDYEAHLQVKSIWLRGEIQGSISKAMGERLEEHYLRMPGDPFYAYVWGCYSGNQSPAIDAILAGTVGDYVRCEEREQCELAHRIFVTGQILNKFGALP